MGHWQMNDDEANALAPQGIPGTYANIKGVAHRIRTHVTNNGAPKHCASSPVVWPSLAFEGVCTPRTFELTDPTAACERFADAAATDAAGGCSQRSRRSGREPCRSGRADGTRQAPAGRLLVA
jgi:hypothetical protein